jgi:hypothetical protein
MATKKLKLQKDFALLTFSMFVIVCFWVGFNIYNTYVTSTIDAALQEAIIPISEKFDTATMEELKQRANIEPDFTYATATTEAPQETSTTIQQNTVSITPTPIPSTSLEITSTNAPIEENTQTNTSTEALP